MTGTYATLGWLVAGGSLTGGAGAVGVAVAVAGTDAEAVGETDGAGATAGLDEWGTAIAGPASCDDDRLFSTNNSTMTRTTAATEPSGGPSRRNVADGRSPAR